MDVPSSRVCAHQVSFVSPPPIEIDPDLTARYVEDAAHFPDGHAAGVVRPRSVEQLAACLRENGRVLPIGAQSSLTGGATPMGEVVLSTERLTSLEVIGDRVVAGAGVTLQSIEDTLAPFGRWFPPVPTYLGATAGGAVATCAAGAATFKYGTVRPWVIGITVVLAGGDVLKLERGQAVASPDGTFDIETSGGVRRVIVPAITMPDVPKRSAGYFAEPGMDLVDLFIGSEGTLAAIASVTLQTMVKPAAVCRWLVPTSSESAAISLVHELRRASRETRASHDPRGIDIASIEHLDARSIALIREDGLDRRLNLTLPALSEPNRPRVEGPALSEPNRPRVEGPALSEPLANRPRVEGLQSSVILLVELELSPEAAAHDLWSEVAAARDPGAADSPIVRFCRMLDRHNALEHAEVALPADRSRAAAFAELREAVPAAVNRRVALARQHIDPRISKTAADMIVPFDRFAEMMTVCRRIFDQRDLDLAVWGHISDGNVHPNLIPKSYDDVVAGREAIAELGKSVIAMGGCPLAEHGVGRNPTKQAMLQLLYGVEGVNAMRRVKQALDPDGRFAPGVIFTR
jgi:D-lactate dehydrogenase (cytochrome)